MSRHLKTGLAYFPLDCGFFKDRAIRRLISRFGSDGALFYLYILAAAYENGYYVVCDEEFLEDAALDLNCSYEKIGLMLDYLLNKTLLDRTLFDTVKVLTSHGIQAQYQQVMRDLKRDVEVDGNLWLLEKNETMGFVKVCPEKNKSGIYEDKSGIYTDKSGIFALKEKENKNKENKRKTNQYERAPAREEEAVETDEELSRVMTLYMGRIQAIPSPSCVEMLKGYTEELGADVVCHAIERALDADKRSWSYIQGILRRYSAERLTSLEAVERDEAEHRRRADAKRPRNVPDTDATEGPVTQEVLDDMRKAVEKLKAGGA